MLECAPCQSIQVTEKAHQQMETSAIDYCGAPETWEYVSSDRQLTSDEGEACSVFVSHHDS